MEHLDPIETARRILAGESLVENNTVEEELEEYIEDIDIEEVEEMAHGKKKKGPMAAMPHMKKKGPMAAMPGYHMQKRDKY